jgi:hypothetical protein
MRGELAAVSDTMQLLRQHPERLRELADLSDFNGEKFGPRLPANFVARLTPGGWYYQNQLHYARSVQAYYVPLADVDRAVFWPEKMRLADASLGAKNNSPFDLCARLALPTLATSVKKFAHGQASVNLARTAVALERWRLAHGEIPDLLASLAPQCFAKVPHDVIGGQALKYRRGDGDRFVLYSVGWNETDDGGLVSCRKDGSVDLESGDWVWPYPNAISR